MARTKTQRAPVADICLYGGATHGAGYFARTIDGRMFGDGEIVQTRSLTSAIWLACQDLCDAGVESGTVRVFEPRGELMASFQFGSQWPYFGNLKWTAAPQLVINAADLEAEAARQARARGESC